MSESTATGRTNQKTRTRKHLLQAASRLAREGRTPSLEEIAEEALVSRATAYRYFPNVDALLLEASLDIDMPEPDGLFRDETSADPIARLEQLDAAMDEAIARNEPQLRRLVAHAIVGRIGAAEADQPARQNRRTPLIDAALAPARREFKPSTLQTLRKALALVIGTESMLVFKDVLELDEAEARRVKRWVIRALVEAARK